MIAKIFFIQGTIGLLAPKPTLAVMQGIKDPTPLNIALVEDFSGWITAIGLALHALQSQEEKSATRALGFGGIPLCLIFSKWVLNNEPPKFGMPMKSGILCLTVASIMTISGLYEPTWGSKALNFIAWFTICNGVGMIAPKVYGATFEITGLSPFETYQHRMLAAVVMTFGLFARSILNGTPPTRALALALTPMSFIQVYTTLVTREVQNLGLKPVTPLLWVLLHALLVAS